MQRKQGENSLDTLRRLGFSKYIDAMLFFDFLICNRDRHGKNIEFNLVGNQLNVVPLFDTGISFVAPYGKNEEAICAFNAMRDVQANKFVGTQSLQANLSLIQNPVYVKPLTKETRIRLFKGLSVCLPKYMRDKIW
mgnify:FL=1